MAPSNHAVARARAAAGLTATALGLAGIALVAAPAAAAPATFTVTNTSSNVATAGSLAWAIAQANTNGNPTEVDTIDFALADLVIPLTVALPDIEQSVTITGPDRTVPLQISIAGTGTGIFYGDASAASILTISNLELIGDNTGSPANGIYAGDETDLVVFDLIVHDFAGVGVFGQDNDTTITNVESYENEYGFYWVSGGSNSLPGDHAELTGVNAHDNDDDGARIWAWDGSSATVSGGVFDDNTAGSGLSVQGRGSATLFVTGASATGNQNGITVDAIDSTIATVNGITTIDNSINGIHFGANGTGRIGGSGNTSDGDFYGLTLDASDNAVIEVFDSSVTDAYDGLFIESYDSAEVIVDGASVTDSDNGGVNIDVEDSASAELRHAVIDDNENKGVRIFATGESVLIADSIITSNGSTYGGGVYVSNVSGSGAGLEIVRTTISQNGASDGDGGGIYVDEISMTEGYGVRIIDSTISRNGSVSDGGGIYDEGNGEGVHAMLISNSTISENGAEGDGGAIYFEGGIDNELLIEHSTIADNGSDEGVGGLYFQDAGVLFLGHTILADNGQDLTLDDPEGTELETEYSILESVDAAVIPLLDPAAHTRTGIDPKLGPLQHNGGPTWTQFLLPGSPAIDTGDPAFTPPPATDQRGEPRVVNIIDIGAVEVPRALAATGSVMDVTWLAAGAALLLLGGALVLRRGRRVADSEA